MPFTLGQYLTANDLNSQELAHTLGYGVVNGLKVVPTDPATMTVDVEIGKAYAADTLVVKGAITNLAVSAADPTNPRKDIVVCNSAGTLSIVAGTPEAALPNGNVGVYTLNPEPPNIPANNIILGEIWVPAGATEITGGEIYDKRVSIADFIGLEVGDLKPPTEALDMNSQDITGVNSLTASELHGTTYWGDVHFEDVECPLCRRKFKKGDKVILMVNVVEEKYISAFPVHLKCSES
ncbi:hypothetical protein ES703_22168 [subsurface metagenome]